MASAGSEPWARPEWIQGVDDVQRALVAVLRLMCQGLSDQQIARELGLSARTVQRRLHNAAKNLGVTSRASLAAHAVALGLVKISDR